MRVENILIRSRGEREVDISWTSETAETVSFVLINGRFYLGPYSPGTMERNTVLPIPSDKTYLIEVFDFSPEETASKDFLLQSLEEPIRTSPEIEWNAAESASAYRIYHAIFNGSNDAKMTLAATLPALTNERQRTGCPKLLEGRGGRWHWFKVNSVDQFGNESENEMIKFFAGDLPPVPKLTIIKNAETKLLSFQIN